MINIAEKLKDAPEGMNLFSPLFGNLEFVKINTDDNEPPCIEVKACGGSEYFHIDGRFYGDAYPDAECLLFPSKDCRTWEGWKLPVQSNFKVGDWVVFNNNHNSVYRISKIKDTFYILIHIYDGSMPLSFSQEELIRPWTIEDAKDGDVLMTTSIRNCPFIYRKTSYNNNLAYYYAGVDGNGDFCEGCLKRTLCHFGSVKNVVPATKEQRDLLFAKMKEAGYQWDADKKELRKIQPHYDIANFKPKQWVLVRDDNEWEWALTRFSHLSNGSASLFVCINGASFQQCIPLEGNESLLGAINPCDERYINW